MGSCQSIGEVSSAEKKKSKLPLFYEVKTDLELNSHFVKLQEYLKRLTDMSTSQNQYQLKLNNLLGISHPTTDIYHTIKSIIVTILAINHCDSSRMKSFCLTDKSPYFSGDMGKAQNKKEIQTILSSYKQLMNCTKENKDFIQQILEQINLIEKYIATSKNLEFLQFEQNRYNFDQLKASREKVNYYANQFIQPILEDHSDAIAHFENILAECNKKSQNFHEQKIYNINQISDSIFADKTATSI